MSLKPQDEASVKRVCNALGWHELLNGLGLHEFKLLDYLIDHPHSTAKACAIVFLPHLQGSSTVYGTSCESGGWRTMGRWLHKLLGYEFVVHHEDGTWSLNDHKPCEHDWVAIKAPIWVRHSGKVRQYMQCKICKVKESWARKLPWGIFQRLEADFYGNAIIHDHEPDRFCATLKVRDEQVDDVTPFMEDLAEWMKAHHPNSKILRIEHGVVHYSDPAPYRI